MTRGAVKTVIDVWFQVAAWLIAMEVSVRPNVRSGDCDKMSRAIAADCTGIQDGI